VGWGNFFGGLPILNGGRIRSNIRVEDARLDQAILVYEDTLSRSLEDVENALTSFEREREQRAIIERAVANNRRAVQLAKELYTAGLSDFLSVLEAQKALFINDDALARNNTAVSTDLVAL
jgi:outer membrane protein, multidrug efflux system